MINPRDIKMGLVFIYNEEIRMVIEEDVYPEKMRSNQVDNLGFRYRILFHPTNQSKKGKTGVMLHKTLVFAGSYCPTEARYFKPRQKLEAALWFKKNLHLAFDEGELRKAFSRKYKNYPLSSFLSAQNASLKPFQPENTPRLGAVLNWLDFLGVNTLPLF